MSVELRVVSDAGRVADAVATEFLGLLPGLAGRRSVHLAVSGGSVATAVLPAILRGASEAGLDWSRWHWWFADERFVAADDADRNARDVLAALAAAGVPLTGVHEAPSSGGGEAPSSDAAAAARQYETELLAALPRDARGLPVFDLVLLGAGPDGHTASLFPGDARVGADEGRAVIEVLDSPKPPPQRVTLTLPVLRAADRVWAIVTGAGKADAVATALTEPNEPLRSPLGAALRGEERLLFLDRAAAGR